MCSFSHPQEQKTPLVDRLQRWYMDILFTAQSRGSVCGVTNMVEEYMSDKFNRRWVRATRVRRRGDDIELLRIPHFYGDLWIQESEDRCKALLESGHKLEWSENEPVSTLGEDTTQAHAGKRRIKRGRLMSACFDAINVRQTRVFHPVGVPKPPSCGETATPVSEMWAFFGGRGSLPGGVGGAGAEGVVAQAH